MSIRPVDLQVIVPKTSDIGKLQHLEDRRHGVNQQMFSENMQQQTDLINHSVVATNKQDYIKNNENKKNKQSPTPEKRNKRSKQDEDSELKETSSISMFDISI